MGFVPSECVLPRGELYKRSEALYKRLEADIYRFPGVFENGGDWPGDWCGRAVLAQTVISRSLHTDFPGLRETVCHLKERLNSRGYLGPDDRETIDEQQIAGHSWLLRGLCEYYKDHDERFVIELISGIVRGLYLPAADGFSCYRARSSDKGEYSGSIASEDGVWKYSTDTGCAFIALDGLTASYELLSKTENAPSGVVSELKRLTEIMAEKFISLDPVRLKMQTHATLTAVRGILRLYDISENKEERRRLFEKAADIFDRYVRFGMSAAYGNYNWFGRPEWTEPCAMIDSFMAAVQLFVYTGDAGYLNTASKIKSAVYHAQRRNGGFGCDTCVGAVKNDGDIIDTLRMSVYEAYWCCTMRGGEGLGRISQYSYLYDGDTLIIPYLNSSELDFRGMSLTETAEKDSVSLRITRIGEFRKIVLYTHGWMNDITVSGCAYSADDGKIELDIVDAAGDIRIGYDTPIYSENCIGTGNVRSCRIMFAGDSILGSLDDIGENAGDLVRFAVSGEDDLGVFFRTGGTVMRRIDDSWLLGEDEEKAVYRLLLK